MILRVSFWDSAGFAKHNENARMAGRYLFTVLSDWKVLIEALPGPH
jgi:hypothetical protein